MDVVCGLSEERPSLEELLAGRVGESSGRLDCGVMRLALAQPQYSICSTQPLCNPNQSKNQWVFFVVVFFTQEIFFSHVLEVSGLNFDDNCLVAFSSHHALLALFIQMNEELYLTLMSHCHHG